MIWSKTPLKPKIKNIGFVIYLFLYYIHLFVLPISERAHIDHLMFFNVWFKDLKVCIYLLFSVQQVAKQYRNKSIAFP